MNSVIKFLLHPTITILSKTKQIEKRWKFFEIFIKEKEIIICGGQAGTGKTFLSCAEALKLLQSEDKFKKIVNGLSFSNEKSLDILEIDD